MYAWVYVRLHDADRIENVRSLRIAVWDPIENVLVQWHYVGTPMPALIPDLAAMHSPLARAALM